MATKTFLDVLLTFSYCIVLGGVVAFIILCVPYIIGRKTGSFYNSSAKAKKIVISICSVVAVALIAITWIYLDSAFTESRIDGIDRVVVEAGEDYINNADTVDTKLHTINKALIPENLEAVSMDELNDVIISNIGTIRKDQQKSYLRLHMWGLVDSQNEKLFAALMDELAVMPAMAYEIDSQIKLLAVPEYTDVKATEAYNTKVAALTELKNSIEKQFITLKREYKEIKTLSGINDMYKKVVKANDDLLGQTTNITISIKTPIPEDSPSPAVQLP